MRDSGNKRAKSPHIATAALVAAIVVSVVVLGLGPAVVAGADAQEVAGAEVWEGEAVTGEIRGTLAGEPFVYYTMANPQGLYDGATALWDGPFSGGHTGTRTYWVQLHGSRSRDRFDPVQSIKLEFSFDEAGNVDWLAFPASTPIAYFPEGNIFDLDLLYTMTEGTIEVTETTWHGQQLELKGTFVGTLMRPVLTEQGTWSGQLVDPIEIEGAFHIWNASYAGQ